MLLYNGKNKGSPCESSKRYKLFYEYEEDAWSLYCLTDDIGEKKNLAQEKPEVARALSAKLQAWLNQEHPTWKPKFPISKKTKQPVPEFNIQ
jgi:hypothetical protein